MVLIITVIISVWMSLFAFAGDIQSYYSDINNKTCKVIKQARPGEGDWETQRCVGVRGYDLNLEIDDARESLTVIHGRQKYALRFFDHINGLFHLGDKVEWRFQDKEPMALIVRVFIHEVQDADTTRKKQVLVVAKVGQSESCVVKVIEVSKEKNANAAARTVADDSRDMKCLAVGTE